MSDDESGLAEANPFAAFLDLDSDDEATESTPLETVSEAELATVIDILGRIRMEASFPENLRSRRLRDLRKALRPVLDDIFKNMFDGGSIEDYVERIIQRRIKTDHLNRRMNHDRILINKTKLRDARLNEKSRLELLMQPEEGTAIPRILDGAVEDDGGTSGPIALEAGGSETGVPPTLDVDARGDDPEQLLRGRACYVCKVRFYKMHHFYDLLCPSCSALNYTKRHQTADMKGQVALVTGARVKIGFQVTLKLLRAGATVIATTRFPIDACKRFAKTKDFDDWKGRLHVFGLDFRDLRGVENFVLHIQNTFTRLDAIINNATQTVRRPPAYYAHLLDDENKGLDALPTAAHDMLAAGCQYGVPLRVMDDTTINKSAIAGKGPSGSPLGDNVVANDALAEQNFKNMAVSAAMSQMPLVAGDEKMDRSLFPENVLDHNGQQVDLRDKHSWTMKLEEISTPELFEVIAINQVTPFILNAKLRGLMEKTPGSKYIVNVSAMEGKFYRFKTAMHPHTNMAKAAINMMTRTSAQDYATANIYMTAVDTGWINDENPVAQAEKYAAEHNFQTPIDEIDAAARILDPVFDGINTGATTHGVFLKDYHTTEW